MIINVTFDASVESNPDAAAFEACAEGVAKFYETQFTNAITINWDVGWGEVDGMKIPAFGGAESYSNYTTNEYSYAQIRAAFAKHDKTADEISALASLPTTDPTDGGMFQMTTAEAKALGFDTQTTGIDGWSGLDKSSTWIYNTTNTTGADVPEGDLDAFSFLAHELSEVMGRQMNFAPTDPYNYGGTYYPYDLFDYTAAGVRSFSSSASDRYFSDNGGKTNTGQHYFNDSIANGDPFDWLPNGMPGSYLPNGPPDSYDYEGSIGAVSGTDLRLMDVLGYDPTTLFTWQTQISGTFGTAADWTAGVTPRAADAALLMAPGAKAYTVTASANESVYSIHTGATATLAISAGVFTAVAGTGSGSNAGTIDVKSGATLALGGNFASGKGLNLSSGATLIVSASNVSLTGSGATVLAGGVIKGASSAATLTNDSRLIDGTGDIGDGEMKLVNEAGALIQSSGASPLTINTGTNSIDNAGMIEAGTGGLTIASAVDNTGQLIAQSSTLTANGAVTGSGTGVIESGTLDFDSTFNENVTFDAGATGTLELAHSEAYGGQVTGFSTSGKNALDLADITFVSGTTTATFAGTATSGVLTVKYSAADIAKITLEGDYRGLKFTTSNDGHGGTKVVEATTAVSATVAASHPATQAIDSFVQAMAGFGAVASAPVAPTSVEALRAPALVLASPMSRSC
jgi:hypothetical protein